MTRGHQTALASGTPARGSVSIGQVLDELSPEFPDISPSKIRFLESEGLIQPLRSSSGYRRFSAATSSGSASSSPRSVTSTCRCGSSRNGSTRSTARRPTGLTPVRVPPVAMTRSELLAAAGAAEELLAELEDYGLIRRARSYGTQTLSVLRSAVRLGEYGIQPRHLRVIKAAADRETALVEQAVAPLTRQKGSREPALRAAQDLAGHIASLHATLVEDGLAEAGLASQPQLPGTPPGESREARGLRSASGR